MQKLACDTQFVRMRIGGMDTLLAPRPGSGLVAATATIRRGSADEGAGEFGLAAFTTAMLMRGTARRTSEQLAFDLESIGALANDEQGMDRCGLGVRAAVSEATEALGLLFEMLREPAFDPDEHEVHRQETLAQLRMIEDEKFGYTFRQFQKAIFAGHGYGHPTDGEREDVEAITPEACRRWHAEAIRPETLLLVVVGDFNVDEWRGKIEGLVAGWRPEIPAHARLLAPPPAEHPPLVELSKPELQQGFIVGGFRTPPPTHTDYPALRLASAALGEGFGGRIFTHLRDEKSLAYALGASLYPFRLAGYQLLYIGTKPTTIEEARAGLLEEAGYLKEHLLSEEEINRAREYVIGKYLMGRQSHSQRAAGLAWWEDAAGDAMLDSQWPARLAEVTAGQVLEAARRWWNEPTLAILRPQA